MAFFSIRLAATPADKEHPYGHEKVENVSGGIEAVLIFVTAGPIIVGATCPSCRSASPPKIPRPWELPASGLRDE